MKPSVGYASQPRAMDPRSTEAWALSEASRRLVIAARNDDKGKSLREALVLNQRLWTIFQSALTEENCPLPKGLRDNVLALSVLMDRHILQRLGDLDGTKIQPILDINRAIADGLAQTQAEDANVASALQAAPAAPMTEVKARPVLNLSA
jgi:flagellar biosynthesis activator protein FlaF